MVPSCVLQACKHPRKQRGSREEAAVHESHTHGVSSTVVVQLGRSGCGPWSPRPCLYGRLFPACDLELLTACTWVAVMQAEWDKEAGDCRAHACHRVRAQSWGLSSPFGFWGPDPGVLAPLHSPNLVSSISTTSSLSPD